jgi:hypothetical protein
MESGNNKMNLRGHLFKESETIFKKINKFKNISKVLYSFIFRYFVELIVTMKDLILNTKLQLQSVIMRRSIPEIYC